MKCPLCKHDMRKVKWEISNNFMHGADFKEYDKTTYSCHEDDTWVTVETPFTEPTRKK